MENIMIISHFLCDFPVNPRRSPGFLRDKVGNPHNDVIAATQECRQQNEGHNLGRAAQIKDHCKI